ncbi:MAG: hypothetical protein HQL60_01820 [Magnetococcales bacterium]|nr:hypothetical protein [Magnetococcales bacterium]
MSESIYLLGEDGLLRGMQERSYESEDSLQTLVERYPELLAGDQISPACPRRWLLISREMAVPGEADGSNRWSLDHLFVDQDGIPTLVEVKRSSDTRIRREVVGQMLDYAANGIVYWPTEMMRGCFEATCKMRHEDPDAVLARFLDQGGNNDPGVFWNAVDSNLRSGRIRLVFLADQIPAELQRVVEFLNEQMARVDVIAVELKQFVGQGIQTLVPRLIGQTVLTKQKQEGRSAKKQWDEESFLNLLNENKGGEIAAIAKRMIDWMRRNSDELSWGSGKENGSVAGVIKRDGKAIKPFYIYSTGVVYVPFPFPPDHENRYLLFKKINAIDGIKIEEEKIKDTAAWPPFSLAVLQNEASLNQFFDVYQWVIDELHKG